MTGLNAEFCYIFVTCKFSMHELQYEAYLAIAEGTV